MTTPLPGNTSGTARLMMDAPGFAVGWQERIRLAQPAAGAVWSHTIDGRYWQRFVAVTFTFNASAVVANRLITMQLVDADGALVIEAECGGLVAANAFLTVNLTADAPGFDTGAAGHSYGYIPGFLTPPGWKWNVVVAGMDVGDQFSAITLLVQRFPNDTTQVDAGE